MNPKPTTERAKAEADALVAAIRSGDLQSVIDRTYAVAMRGLELAEGCPESTAAAAVALALALSQVLTILGEHREVGSVPQGQGKDIAQ